MRKLIISLMLILSIFSLDTVAQTLSINPEELLFSRQLEGIEIELENISGEPLSVGLVGIFPWDSMQFEVQIPESRHCQAALKDVRGALSEYFEEQGEEPETVEDLIREGYLDLEEEMFEMWEFTWSGLFPPGWIFAVSTSEMPDGEGHRLFYDVQGHKMLGYGTWGTQVWIQIDVDEVRNILVRYYMRSDGPHNGHIMVLSSTAGGEGDTLFIPIVGDVNRAVSESQLIPSGFEMSASYPNPFNSQTIINYKLPKAMEIELILYDLKGRHVRALYSGHATAAHGSVTIDGSELASGEYIVKMVGNGAALNQMVVLIK
ncbi:MAG: T9SS type A sorting domain-containing protein [Calditrichaeota bacterium]|nr:T9SS type A sorting domain-containing protein [Calditrichota bacterium]MBT7616010.1 T9SS type A sorting domain-containing protein [Calditrichota bacterium]MBT7790043.1 T9SS type A sorting domain-containing protein [Calditrichota bacterium]